MLLTDGWMNEVVLGLKIRGVLCHGTTMVNSPLQRCNLIPLSGSEQYCSLQEQDRKTLFNHGGFAKLPILSQSISKKQLCMSVTVESQSSICVGSPTSILKPNDGDKQANAAISGSSGEQSDDDDAEIEVGPCEQSTDAVDLKRIQRKVSNRESARRSRKRRQTQLAELEWQVEKLNCENHSLYKELTEATQQLRDAATNNRVLKSGETSRRIGSPWIHFMQSKPSYSDPKLQLFSVAKHSKSPAFGKRIPVIHSPWRRQQQQCSPWNGLQSSELEHHKWQHRRVSRVTQRVLNCTFGLGILSFQCLTSLIARWIFAGNCCLAYLC